MENTCVLDILPVIPNWKIFKIPPKKLIRYSCILKQKKEFQSLIENGLCGKNLLSNACTIVDRKTKSSENNKNLEVIFLNQVQRKYSLCLSIHICEKHVLKRCSNILKFLKHCKKSVPYFHRNSSIYIKCDADLQWEIFYCLYEFLLMKYDLTIIGALFYNSCMTKDFLHQEKLFLHYIHMDSRNKRKITQVKDMSNENLCNHSNKRIKSICDKKTPVMNQSSQEFSCKVPKNDLETKTHYNVLLRKNLLTQGHCKQNKCCCDTLNCKCHQAKWKVFKDMKKYVVNSYLDILLTKNIFSDSQFSFSQENKDSSIVEALPIAETNNLMHSTVVDKLSEKSLHEASSVNICNTALQNENSDEFLDQLSDGVFLTPSSNDVPNNKTNFDKLSNEGFHISNHNTPLNITAKFQKLLPDETVTVPKSDNKLHNNVDKLKENLPSEINLPSISNMIDQKNNEALNMKKNSLTEADESLKNQKYSSDINTKSGVLMDTKSTLNFMKDKGLSSLFEEFSEVANDKENELSFGMFQTAAGKKVNISQTAFKAAEKMLAETLQSDEASSSKAKHFSSMGKRGLSRKADYKNKVELGESSSIYENAEGGIDGDLAQKIFEDFSFEERKIETSSVSASLKDTCDKSNSIGKVRKSLGGRRSLKPYSAQKP